MILITLPHGKRNEGDGYDAGAIEFLPVLEAALRARARDIEIVVGKSNREMVDLNRRAGASTEFMNEVRSKLKDATLHIDIHSYPYRDEGTAEDDSLTTHGHDLRNWGLNDVMLFQIPEVTDELLLDTIDTNLQANGIDVGVEIGSYDNYLTVVASVLFDTPSILIELNENSVQVYPVVAAQVAESLQEYEEGGTNSSEEAEVPN